MFAAAHGYYALTYGVASPVFYIELVTFGVAMSIAFYWSGGNIWALAVVHGLNDAIGFLGVATNLTIGGINISHIALGIFIGVGLVFTFVYVVIKKVRLNPSQTGEQGPQAEQPPPPPPPPPPPMV